MWVRETQEDLTAAEFAISLDASPSLERRKRAIDYDNLLTQLDRRLFDLACEDVVKCNVNMTSPTLTPGQGMGIIVYDEAQREALFK